MCIHDIVFVFRESFFRCCVHDWHTYFGGLREENRLKSDGVWSLCKFYFYGKLVSVSFKYLKFFYGIFPDGSIAGCEFFGGFAGYSYFS